MIRLRAALGQTPTTPPTTPRRWLVGLPSTERVLAAMAELDAQYAAARAQGSLGDMRRARQEVQRADGLHLRCLERDALQAERPADCWCLGEGGREPRAALGPDGEPVTFFGQTCCCPEGIAAAAMQDAARQEIGAWQKEQAARRSWQDAGIPERFRACTLDTYPDQASPTLAQVRTWLEGPCWALVLSGSFGVGKTGLAVGVIQQAAALGKSAIFKTAPDLLVTIRASYGPNAEHSDDELLRGLREVPLLVLDDVGAEKATDWATALLFSILNGRHDRLRKTILTTNLAVPGELAAHLGRRTMERFQEGGLVLSVAGKNLRRKAPPEPSVTLTDIDQCAPGARKDLF